MAIGALLGEQHSFIHRLKSFFWVLFWICVHYEGPGQERVVPRFNKWNSTRDMEELAGMKPGVIADQDTFHKTMAEFFTEYHGPLIPWASRLCRVVFPNGGGWKREDNGLYLSMKRLLWEAQGDSRVLSDV